MTLPRLKAARAATAFIAAALLLSVPATASAVELSQPEYQVIRDHDVTIPMRDGAALVADVFRPDGAGRFPVIMSLGAYQKDLEATLPYGKPPFTHRETPEPEWWTARGYVVIRVDSRGTGKSPGKTDIWSAQEARDYYDAIEWAAGRAWSNGKIGLAGVSYYSIVQWNVASLRPPSLTTILVWEGWSDTYRDAVFQGGVFNLSFLTRWWTHVQARQLLERTRVDNPAALEEHLMWNYMVHNLDGPWWDEVKARAQFDRIEVPLYSSGNWGGWNHHMRGNVEGFLRSASEHKKLQMHIGGHTDAFFSDEGKIEMLRWFDYWLKGIDTGIMDEPPISLCIRTSVSACDWRFENEWPLARTQFTKYYLSPAAAGAVADAVADGTLAGAAPAKAGAITYWAGPDAYLRARAGKPTATFVTPPLDEDVEITGPINLVMWVSSETEDMDIFAYLRNMAPDGTTETLTRGILKVSHRKLDEALSTPYRPYHTHDGEEKLEAGEVVRIEVEILPTSMIFKKGHRIRLDIAPHDAQHYDGAYKIANNTIYTGGDRASYVLLPIVPAK